MPGKPSWEIVQPEKQTATGHASGAAGAGAGAGRADWELGTAERRRIDDRHKDAHNRGDDEEEEDDGTESLAQALLSYAGLVAALLVILLGILFMIGAKAT